MSSSGDEASLSAPEGEESSAILQSTQYAGDEDSELGEYNPEGSLEQGYEEYLRDPLNYKGPPFLIVREGSQERPLAFIDEGSIIVGRTPAEGELVAAGVDICVSTTFTASFSRISFKVTRDEQEGSDVVKVAAQQQQALLHVGGKAYKFPEEKDVIMPPGASLGFYGNDDLSFGFALPADMANTVAARARQRIEVRSDRAVCAASTSVSTSRSSLWSSKCQIASDSLSKLEGLIDNDEISTRAQAAFASLGLWDRDLPPKNVRVFRENLQGGLRRLELLRSLDESDEGFDKILNEELIQIAGLLGIVEKQKREREEQAAPSSEPDHKRARAEQDYVAKHKGSHDARSQFLDKQKRARNLHGEYQKNKLSREKMHEYLQLKKTNCLFFEKNGACRQRQCLFVPCFERRSKATTMRGEVKTYGRGTGKIQLENGRMLFFGQRSVRGRVPQRAVGARVEVGAVQAAKKQNHLDEAVNVSFV